MAAAILTLAVSISANRAAATLFAGPRTAMFVYSGWLLILTGSARLQLTGLGAQAAIANASQQHCFLWQRLSQHSLR